MNNEYLYKLAKDAGAVKALNLTSEDVFAFTLSQLGRFHAATVRATAEDCAKVCEAQKQRLGAQLHHHGVVGAEECADAIRRHARTKFQDQATSSGEKGND